MADERRHNRVSEVLLGPPFETPYDDLKDAILRRSTDHQPPEPRFCNQQSGDYTLLLYSHPQASPFSYESVSTQQTYTVTRQVEARMTSHVSMGTVEVTCAEELRHIPEATLHISTDHPENLHWAWITPPTTYRQNE